MKPKSYFIVFLAFLIALSGCAAPQIALRKEAEIYPINMRPDAPFVLAIPGLNLPGCPIRQEQHFGNLVQMLADKGIPSKVLVYDSDEFPLTYVANLDYDETSIAVTRITPSLDNEVDAENVRRAGLNLPPVKELVIFSYSQGSVMASRIITRINHFKAEYRRFTKKFGQEWIALQQDPEFVLMMGALIDYIAIRDIKVQREKDFLRDRDLQGLYKHLKSKIDKQTEEFGEYLLNPAKKYPNVVNFEPPESPKYPKAYPKFSEYVRKCRSSATCRDKLKNFMLSYASFDDLINTDMRFISTAGSFFGSPNADQGYALAEIIPPLKLFIGRELNQIKDTRLGSPQQLKSVRYLYDYMKKGWYPYSEKDTLFILGIDVGGGDGLVGQSSAHLADHYCVIVTKGKDGKPELNISRLPDFYVVPLHFTHLPQRTLFWESYGAAYMVKGNPVFEYLVDFINKDWNSIENNLSKSKLQVRQFMVEACGFDASKKRVKLNFRLVSNSNNVSVEQTFYNTDSMAVVWTGKFTAKDDYMNLTGPEEKTGTVTFEYWIDSGVKNTIDVPIMPGSNTFVAIKVD